MNKRLIIFGVLLAALLLSAVSPWPATLQVLNYTGDNVYITLKFRGVQKYFLTATSDGNAGPDYYHLSVFDITRLKYSATVTACQTTVSGTMDLKTNLHLNFTSCDAMRQWWTPKYLKIDRGFEKPNFYDAYLDALDPGYFNPNNLWSVYTTRPDWLFMVYGDKPNNLYQNLKWATPFQFVY